MGKWWLTFFWDLHIYIIYVLCIYILKCIKKFGQSFFHTYLLTCSNKDASVLLKVVNIKTFVLNF